MIIRDEWLSRYFDQGAYIYKAPFDEAKIPHGFTCAKIKSNDIKTVQNLCDQGFKIVETAVQFEQQTIVKPSRTDGEYVTRPTTDQDSKQVTEIAKTAFTASRLYQDTNISEQTAGQIKVDWTGNFYNGKRGDAMIVAEKDGEVAGFLMLIGNVIDLIAVSQNHTQKGIATRMIAHANQTAGLLSAGTQIINHPSIALYQKCGFILKNAQYVMHAHI